MGLRAQSGPRFGIACAATCALVLLGAAAPASGARPIRGELSEPGHTLIALAASGKAQSVRVSGERFRLRPPAGSVTLHLRGPDGTYAGPVVVGRERRGKRAILGIRAGARLGEIAVRKHYAKPVEPVKEKWIDSDSWSRARRGIPKGAGRFGRIRARVSPGTVAGDSDLDGIPGPLDIDDDGDLVLDNLDSSPGGSAAQAPGEAFAIGSEFLIGADAVNVNAGSDIGDIDDALSSKGRPGPFGGRLTLSSLPSDSPPELDCVGLSYCSTGGSGRALFPGNDVHATAPRFPDKFDSDEDGFGELSPAPGGLYLSHGATSSEIRTGQVLIQRVVRDGVEIEFPGALQYVFVTGPVLIAYADTAGTAASVSYPFDTRDTFQVAPGADGRVVLTLTFFRPQRRRIAGDPAPSAGQSGEWTDIGGLTYAVDVSNVSGSSGPSGGQCPQNAFSTSDPNLAPAPPTPGSPAGGLVDNFRDTPASPENILTFTLDAGLCPGVGSWDEGVTVSFNFRANRPGAGTTYQSGMPFQHRTD